MRQLKLLFGTLVTVGLLVALGESTAYARHAFAPFGLAGAVATQEHYTDDLLRIKGVVGTAVGLNADGQPVVKIFVETAEIPGLPRSLDGVPVVVQVTGKIFAMNRPDDNGDHDHGGDDEGETVDPKSRFDRPVPIGVSSGTVASIQSGFFISCSTGTLGARVVQGTTEYALSNNHIYALALENTPNKVFNVGAIVQPGPADAEFVCSNNSDVDLDPFSSDSIGTLELFVPIIFGGVIDNYIDAAIAESPIGMIGQATPSDGYLKPKSDILACTPKTGIDACLNLLGLDVQKYGRTTGLTKGTITDINATILISYNAGTAKFVGQIVVSSGKGAFIKGGDSGSLLVTDPDREPVGLVFAGNRNGKTAFANQIEVVLDAYDVDIDGEE